MTEQNPQADQSDVRGKILGIKLSNVYFPDEIKDKIQGFEIAYAERTTANLTSVSQGVLLPHRDFISGVDGPDFEDWTEGSDTYENPFRFHGFDMLATNTSTLPTHITNQLCVVLPDRDGNTHVFNMIDKDTVDDNFYVEQNNYDQYLRQVKNTKYLQADNSTTLPSNENREECFFGEIETDLDVPQLKEDLSSIASTEDRWYISNMTIYKKNVYISYIEQSLISTGKLFRVSEDTSTYATGNLYGGDTFTYGYAFRYTRRRSNGSDWFTYQLPALGALNGALRHEGQDWYEVYYPKSAPGNFPESDDVFRNLPPDGTLDEDGFDLGPNASPLSSISQIKDHLMTLGEQWYYNNDYTALNQYSKAIPYDPDTTVLTFPNRVARSTISTGAEADEPWRNFLVLDAADTPRHRGEIIDMQAFKDQLLIHTEEALFRTIGSTTVDTSEIAAELGTGDIFRIVPQELLPSDGGYAGTQNIWSSILTKNGYFFVDAKHGKVFLLSDKLEEISNKGMRNYFRDKLASVNDNPFKGDGLNVAYDDKFNRIFLSRTDGTPFTISYSFDLGAWESFHDFTPRAIWNTRTNVYSYSAANQMYQHNDTTTKGTLYAGTKYESDISAVFNKPVGPKYFGTLQWITEIVKQDNTNLYDNTLSKVVAYTKRQCSGEVTLTNKSNMRKFKSIWSFNGFRDVVINNSLPFIDANGALITSNINSSQPWWKQRRMEDHYLIAKLIYDNVGENDLYLYNADAAVREQIR